jgi:DNA invertase Pin-like site-specific DNA recombinase
MSHSTPNGNMKIGYARVSTIDQNLDRQIQALTAAGCDYIYQEKLSGKNTQRPEFNRMMVSLQEGDIIVVSELSRMGRSLGDLLNIITELKNKKVGFTSLKESMDTNSPHGMLIFTIMGALAEFERSLILERQRDGIKAAKKNGKHLGRPYKMDLQQFYADVEAGMGIKDLATKYQISEKTVRRNSSRLEGVAAQ